MNNKLIPAGPFKGTVIPVDATRENADGQGVWWHPRDRTPLVLDRWPIDNGWKINITRHPGEVELPLRDPYSQQFYADSNGVVLRFPTVYITATLTDPNKDVVAEGTTLSVIDGVRAYEAGENNARNRLYEALGLIGAHAIEDFTPTKPSNVVDIIKPETAVSAKEPAPTQPSAPSQQAPASSPMDQVRAVPSTNRHAKRTTAEPAPPVATPEPAAVSPPVTSAQPASLTPSLLALALQRAAMQGKPVPTFLDDDAIQAFLDDLAA